MKKYDNPIFQEGLKEGMKRFNAWSFTGGYILGAIFGLIWWISTL